MGNAQFSISFNPELDDTGPVMIWGKKATTNEARPEQLLDVDQQAGPREKLPSELQQIVDRDDGFFDDVYSSYSVDSTETNYRYAAYANRIRTILLSAHRYVAYTSDVGESFRPIAHPILVRSAYAISWTYLIGDVTHEGYKAYLRNRRVLAPPSQAYKDASDLSHTDVAKGMMTGNVAGPLTSSSDGSSQSEHPELTPWPTTRIPLIDDYRMVMTQRAVFQSIASMGLPAFTIHSVVKYSGRMFKHSKSTLMRTWAPIGLGLSVVPFLPYLFDEPVEEAVEWTFRTAIRAYGGEDEARHLPLPRALGEKSSKSVTEALEEQGSKAVRGAEEEAQKLKAAANVSWEEYKEEKQRERDDRKHQREEQGRTGLSGWFGRGGADSKKPKSD